MVTNGPATPRRSANGGGGHSGPAHNSPAVPYKQAHLHRLISGGTRYRFRAFRLIPKDAGGYLAVVAATDVESASPVVAFGTGATWGDAWEAANQAVGQGRWRPDQYAGTSWAR